ncbi:hypothetical protein [Brevibacterium aurantiacum]|uniref:hypothetical protein n=1 Tax=Brevibacterium aurantiacum TaxID=273384 RepID=UPI0011C044A4|nr:hypothetical protein [Brevibacterium aurantiacum]
MNFHFSFFQGMEPVDVAVSQLIADAYATMVQDNIAVWADQYRSRSDSIIKMGSELIEAHRRLCENPADAEAQNRWRTADKSYWDMEEQVSLDDNGGLPFDIEDIEEDPRDRGYHEGWVWEFRNAKSGDYPGLLEARRREYEKAKAEFERKPWDPEIGLAMDRQKRIWDETGHLVELALADPSALAKMFEPGDSYVDEREFVHPESLERGTCTTCRKHGDTYVIVSFDDGSPRDACTSCAPEFEEEAAQYRPR